MPGGNFDANLNVRTGGIVEAAGPLDQGVARVTEMCVWVFQRQGPDGADAIGNAMGPPSSTAATGDMTGMAGATETPMEPLTVSGTGTADARWRFPLTDRFADADTSDPPADFHEGAASALAIGVF